MTRNDAITAAREISGLTAEEAPVAEANECNNGWDVLFWASEQDADNDDGARALWRGTISED